MAGTLVVDTVKSSTTSAPVFQNTSGTQMGTLCRAWVNFNGTNAFSPNPSTSAIQGQFNVASITKNGTGDFTVNFTTAMPDANYSTVYGGQYDTSGSGAAFAVFGLARVAGAQASGSVRIITGNNVPADVPIVNIAIFR